MNQNTKQKRSAASWLAELAKGRYGEYALSVLTALLGVACSLVPYFIIIQIITALVNGTAELPRCLTLCGWMAGCWVLRYVLHSVSTSLSHHATFHVLANTRTRLLDKLATLPLGTVLDRSSGSYKNIIVERVDSIETTLAHLLPEMTANIVGALAVLVLLFIEDWRMGLSMLIVVPLGIGCFASMFSGYEEKFQRTVTATKALNDTAVEYISGIEVIKGPSASPKPATQNLFPLQRRAQTASSTGCGEVCSVRRRGWQFFHRHSSASCRWAAFFICTAHCRQKHFWLSSCFPSALCSR